MRTSTTLVSAVLAAIVALGGGCGDSGTSDAPSTTASSAATSTPAQAWTECENATDAFAVRYPGDWQTNSGSVLEACSLFDPQPIELEEGTEIPAYIAVSIDVEEVAAEVVVSESPTQRVLARHDSEIDGVRATRAEMEATGEGLYEKGLRFTVWAVAAASERTVILRSSDVGSLPYAEKQEVLDRMAGSLRLLR